MKRLPRHRRRRPPRRTRPPARRLAAGSIVHTDLADLVDADDTLGPDAAAALRGLMTDQPGAWLAWLNAIE